MALPVMDFKTRDTKLERFLHKNQHTQRKLLNFENWTNGVPQYTLMRFSDLKETSTDITADSIFEKFR